MVRKRLFCYWGLEIGGFAAIDIDQNTALHLIADQSLAQKEHASLLDYYAALISCRSEGILAISKYLVVDAFFLEILLFRRSAKKELRLFLV